MFRYLYAMVVMLAALAGCAYSPDVNRERLESLPYHYVKYDAALAWDVVNRGSGMVIEGEFMNRRYAAMENVEIWVDALNPLGRPVARSADFVIPNILRMGEIAPFTVELPVRAEPGNKLRFTYKYLGRNGEGGVGNMMQIFYFEIPSLR